MSESSSVPTSVTGHSRTLRAIASHGLAGSLLDMPQETLADDDFARVHAAVRSQKLTGLFWSAITHGDFPTTGSQRERAEKSHLERLVGVLLLEDLLLHVAQSMEDADIPVRVLKGAAMAHLDYPDPSQRPFGDIDVLVPGDHFDAAVDVLTTSGCRRLFPEPRPGFDRQFGKGACLRTPAGLEIDLHRTFSMGPFGAWLALDEVWATSECFMLAGKRLHALSPEVRFLHAAYHASLGDRTLRLAPLRDVAQLALTRELDWRRVHALMEGSRGEAVVARSVCSAWGELHVADVLAISAWASAYQESPRQASELAVYGSRSSYAARALATVGAIPSMTQKARYVRTLAWPGHSYVADRHSSNWSRLVHAWQEISRQRERA
jgi:hypothetical protein